MRLFVNAGFGSPLGAEFLRELATRGFAGVRQDIPNEQLGPALCEEIAAAEVQSVLLIGGGRMGADGRGTPPAEIARLAGNVAAIGQQLGLFTGEYPSAIEIGNEPDNAFTYGSRPDLFAEAVRRSRDAIRAVAPQAPVITGGIMTTDRKRLDYLSRADAAGLPDDCIIGYHTYRSTQEPEAPVSGFRSRADEFKRLREIAAGRPIWCTETGWHTAPSVVRDGLWGLLKRRVQFTDAQISDFAEREIRINGESGAVGLVWFQLNDGTSPTEFEHCFGVRRIDGSWKPVAERIRGLGPTVA